MRERLGSRRADVLRPALDEAGRKRDDCGDLRAADGCGDEEVMKADERRDGPDHSGTVDC